MTRKPWFDTQTYMQSRRRPTGWRRLLALLGKAWRRG